MTTKRLHRSDTNKVLCGVIGGVGEYFDIDPTIIRLGYIIIAVMTGFGPAVIAYFIAVIIVPKKYHSHEHREPQHDEKKGE